LFLGAEFTQVYAQRHGSRNTPAVIAVPVTDAARSQPDVAAVSLVAATHPAPSFDVRRAHTRFRWRGYPFDRYAAGILGFIVGIIVSVAYGATRR
jgi:membrane protein